MAQSSPNMAHFCREGSEHLTQLAKRLLDHLHGNKKGNVDSKATSDPNDSELPCSADHHARPLPAASVLVVVVRDRVLFRAPAWLLIPCQVEGDGELCLSDRSEPCVLAELHPLWFNLHSGYKHRPPSTAASEVCLTVRPPWMRLSPGSSLFLLVLDAPLSGR